MADGVQTVLNTTEDSNAISPGMLTASFDKDIPMKTIESTNKMLFQLSGLALVLGGAIGATGQYFHPGDPQGPADLVQYVKQGTPVHTALYFAVMLVLLGLPAVYIRQRDKVGISGLEGFLLLFFGLPMVDLVHSVSLFGIVPTLVADSPERAWPLMAAAIESPPWVILEILGFPLAVLGILFFNIPTIRARVLPSWPAWLMLAALLVRVIYTIVPTLPEVGGSLNGILFYLAFAAYGYTLIMDQRAVSQQATAAALT
jgi:hypothetical protein